MASLTKLPPPGSYCVSLFFSKLLPNCKPQPTYLHLVWLRSLAIGGTDAPLHTCKIAPNYVQVLLPLTFKNMHSLTDIIQPGCFCLLFSILFWTFTIASPLVPNHIYAFTKKLLALVVNFL